MVDSNVSALRLAPPDQGAINIWLGNKFYNSIRLYTSTISISTIPQTGQDLLMDERRVVMFRCLEVLRAEINEKE